MQEPDEIALADAVIMLERRISALTGPTNLGGAQWGPSIHQQVRDSLTDRRGAGGGRARGSSPVWLEGMVWIDALNKCAREWTTRTPWGTTYNGPDTATSRLRWLAEEKPRPQDANTIRTWAGHLHGLAHEAANLLDPVLFTVAAPCPECGADHVRLPDGTGDTVRHDALRVRLFSADCAACGARWGETERLSLAAAVAAPRA